MLKNAHCEKCILPPFQQLHRRQKLQVNTHTPHSSTAIKQIKRVAGSKALKNNAAPHPTVV